MFPSHFLHAHLVLSHLLNIFSLGHPISSLMLSTKPQWTLCVSHSHVRLFVTSWTVACQASLSMDFYRQEYWSGLPFPSPGDLPNPGIKLGSRALQADSLLLEPQGKPTEHFKCAKYLACIILLIPHFNPTGSILFYSSHRQRNRGSEKIRDLWCS